MQRTISAGLLGIATLVMAAATAPAGGDNRLVIEGVVDAPIDAVWKAFTTKEGIESWMVAKADIDLKVGGKMRTHYDPNGTLGDANTIENTILSFDSPRMLSIKATKPPANFPFKEAIKSMWTVIYLDAIDKGHTKVTVVSMGFGSDDESKTMRMHFEKGNAYTLMKLQKRFAGK